jgi:hypothetical protein
MMNFASRSIPFHNSKGSLTSCKSLWHGADGFTSSTKEGMLQIFTALKNTSTTAGFEPKNLGCHSKQANHETTEDNKSLYSSKQIGCYGPSKCPTRSGVGRIKSPVMSKYC